MRWHRQEDGEKRTVTRFLIFPKCIGDEWRWLERATWAEHYIRGGGEGSWWGADAWLPNPEKREVDDAG